uniref:DUF7796 domain-containing protein n=1 Tax=Physcomitrium patens TaxID=3218 RepID=A0A7I4BJV0_PHYPA
MMTVVVSKLSWIVSVVFLISVVALVGYQFPAKTPLAHYQLWYPLSTAKENAAPGPNTSNRSELYVGEAGLAAASPVPLEGRFEESTRSRVAVCLVGGARAFELTGKTLMKYVLNAYNDTDVFLHSPLDKDSHKFSLLSGASGLASARVFIPKQLPESRLQREVLTAANSPNGIQGLLQYFHLVEGCLEMITEHESKHNIKLGIGNSENSRVALSRLSLLPLLHKRGARNLNSETAFKAQLKFTNLWYSSTNFPFCILTYRKYSWPPAYFGVPVASLSTKGDLNGAKCRPCTPKSSGSEAQRLVSKLSKGWGWPGLIDGLELCDAHQDWEPQWRTVYEKESGEQLSGDAQRVTTRSVSECVRDMEEFQKQWEVWDAPPPLKICSEGREDEVYSDSDESVN